MKGKMAVTGIYGSLHFLVDFGCAFFMFRMLSKTGNFYLYFFLYNFCAFALQMPAGLLADKWNRNSLTAAAGCLLVSAAYPAMPAKAAALPVALAGLGNCLFHVGGGIEILNEGGDKLSPLGIFVSPGAVGIFLGTLMGKGKAVPEAVPALLLLAGAVFLFTRQRKAPISFESEPKPLSGRLRKKNICLLPALLCLFLVVVFRSHLGMIFSFPWKKETAGGSLALLGIVLGKAAGGIAADQFGIRKTAFVSLFLSAVLFFFSERMVWGIAGLFFFNMSMPITLFLAAKLLSSSKGFAFGILTFAIFLGFLPAWLGYDRCAPMLLSAYSLMSLVLLSAFCLLMGEYRHFRKKEQRV